MNANEPVAFELYDQASGRKLEPGLVRRIISLQRGWRASRGSAKPEEGFLATAFEEGEVWALYEGGGTFFIIRRSDDVVGFALTTGIEKFIEQYDAPAGGELQLTEPLDLTKYVYLYQVVIQKGEQQRGLGRRLMQQVQRGGSYVFRELRLNLASERYRIDFWQKWGLAIVRALLSAFDAERASIPAKHGQPMRATLAHLSTEGASVYPFTAAGLSAFLADSKAAGTLRWGEIDDMTDFWWGRRAPKNLLSTDEQQEGADDGQEQ
jgi:ribosomal protein S18 acetylase RimI-like enzyme